MIMSEYQQKEFFSFKDATFFIYKLEIEQKTKFVKQKSSRGFKNFNESGHLSTYSIIYLNILL